MKIRYYSTNANIGAIVCCSIASACTVGSSDFVSGDNGVVVARMEGGHTQISLDKPAIVADLRRQLALDPTLQEDVAALLSANTAFVSLTKGDRGIPGSTVVVRSVAPANATECAGRTGTRVQLGHEGSTEEVSLVICDGARGPDGAPADMMRVAALEAALVEAKYCPSLLARGANGLEERAYHRAAAPSSDVTVCSYGADEMVRVGDFWIDRYEASIASGSSLGGQSGNDTTAVAISRPAVIPARNVNWFQAAAACANAGKRLCSNTEWQTAALGTADPARGVRFGMATAPPADGACNTSATGARQAGRANTPTGTCVSRYGAEDMIGNLWEWIEFGIVPGAGPTDNQAWPQTVEFGRDAVISAARPPYGIMRGGHYNDGDDAGVFAIHGGGEPANSNETIGFRCCVR